MLTIWIGRAGTGKTKKILQTIEARRNERSQVLIVPEHVSHEAEVDLCQSCGDTASRNAEVLSFRNLASRVLSQTGGLSDFTLDNGGKILTMRRCLQELSSQLKVFGRPSQRSAFLEQLVVLADEFYAYEIAPEVLYQQVQDLNGMAGDKLRDLALLFAAYDGHLRAGDIDTRSRVQKLRDRLPDSDYLQDKDVYFDGFSYFNRVEESIISVILQQAHDVTVTLLGDQGNKDLFENATAQRERLVRLAQQLGVPCEIVYFASDGEGELHHLEQHLFGSDTPWEKDVQHIELYEAGTAFTEVEYVAYRILSLVRSGQCRYRDIAVVSRNMDDYAPILENVFARDGIPAYISRRSDILEKPALKVLLGAVDAVTGGFTYEDMFRYLKTGMAGVSRSECDRLENYVITWDIHGTMWLNDKAWSANPDGYGMEMTLERQKQLDEVNAVRGKVRKPLQLLYEGMKHRSTAANKVEVLYTFAEQTNIPITLKNKAQALLESGQVQLAEEYQQLWKIFCDVLDQFVEILGESEIDGEEFAKLLRLVLTQYSVGTIPATLDQVNVSEITRNDRHNAPYVFLLGANDHVLPQVDKGGGILDTEDRELLQQQNILLSNATFDPLDNELQNIYACLTQAGEHLTVSYPSTDLTGNELRPSFVVARIAKIFPKLRLQHEDKRYRQVVLSTALEAAGEEPNGVLWQYFESTGRYTEQLEAMRRAESVQRGKLSLEAVRTLYGTDIRMSASRMDKIKRCHFGYFMQYGLRAKERRSAGFEAPEIGTFIHYLLENVTRDVMRLGGYAAVDRKDLRAMVQHYVDLYAETEIDGYQEKSARFRYLFQRLRKAAFAMVENIASELAESDFRPMEFELAFGGKDAKLPAITITEGDTTMSVSGKVDRVDGWLQDGKLYLRVVDYKTGKKSFDLTDLQYGLGIQMLLYLFTLRDEGSTYFGYPIVPAGVLYLPARDEILKEERDITEEKLADAFHKALRRSGMVLQEPQVLQAMEHSALEKPSYLPLQVKKDGTITGGVASAAQLGKLGQYVDRLLHEITSELAQGNIDADPCSHSPQDNACMYCEFASACCFEDGRGRDRMRKMKSVKPDEFWAHVDRTIEKEV